jgi:Pyruvate/2-oxoacid:ferredoxin oxidoreductase delta subunit
MPADRSSSLGQIAAHLGYADSAPLLELLDILLSDQEAEWIAALPATPHGLASHLGQDPLQVASGLQDLFMRGLVLVADHTDREPLYTFDGNPGRFMDMVLFDPRYRALGDHFYDLWRDFYNGELVHAPRSPEHLPFRIVPVEQSILDQRCILPYERATEIVRQARRLVVLACPCRMRERACDAPLETCITLDRVADYMTGRHIGRGIGVDEALAILQHAEELGLVHEVENTDHPTVLCACCPCCCVFLRAITHYQQEYVVARSRYRAVVDPIRCHRCETCLERCHFAAMGRRESGMSVDAERCLGCGLCASACPNGAIAMLEVRGPAHIPATPETFMHGIDELP